MRGPGNFSGWDNVNTEHWLKRFRPGVRVLTIRQGEKMNVKYGQKEWMH